jgi:hypothetical protein
LDAVGSGESIMSTGREVAARYLSARGTSSVALLATLGALVPCTS